MLLHSWILRYKTINDKKKKKIFNPLYINIIILLVNKFGQNLANKYRNELLLDYDFLDEKCWKNSD